MTNRNQRNNWGRNNCRDVRLLVRIRETHQMKRKKYHLINHLLLLLNHKSIWNKQMSENIYLKFLFREKTRVEKYGVEE